MIYRGPAFGSSPTASPLSHQQVVSLSQSYRVKAWSSIKRSILSVFLSEMDNFFLLVMSEIFEEIKWRLETMEGA
jgi:hypothetical protein